MERIVDIGAFLPTFTYTVRRELCLKRLKQRMTFDRIKIEWRSPSKKKKKKRERKEKKYSNKEQLRAVFLVIILEHRPPESPPRGSRLSPRTSAGRDAGILQEAGTSLRGV